jgi:hypothetical protein
MGDLGGKVILAGLLAAMAAIGGTLWIVKTVLEVGFHLQERIREGPETWEKVDPLVN